MENYTNNFTNNNNKKFYLLRIQKYPIRGSPAARPQANFIPFPSPCCDNRRWRNGGRRRGADHAVDPVTRDRPPRPPVPSVEKGGHVREGEKCHEAEPKLRPEVAGHVTGATRDIVRRHNKPLSSSSSSLLSLRRRREERR